MTNSHPQICQVAPVCQLPPALSFHAWRRSPSTNACGNAVVPTSLSCVPCAGCCLYLPARSSVAAIEPLHKAQLEAQQAIIVRFDKLDKELVLVPVKVKTGTWLQVPSVLLTSHLLSRACHNRAYWGYPSTGQGRLVAKAVAQPLGIVVVMCRCAPALQAVELGSHKVWCEGASLLAVE